MGGLHSAFSVNRSQIIILKEAHEVGLCSFLQSNYSGGLEAEIDLKTGGHKGHRHGYDR
jgi:hypothetical protein